MNVNGRDALKLRSSTRNVLSQNLKESEQYRRHAVAIQKELRAAAITLGAKRQQFLKNKCKLLHDLDLNLDDDTNTAQQVMSPGEWSQKQLSTEVNTQQSLYPRGYHSPEGHKRAKSCPQPIIYDESTIADILERELTTTIAAEKTFENMDVVGRNSVEMVKCLPRKQQGFQSRIFVKPFENTLQHQHGMARTTSNSTSTEVFTPNRLGENTNLSARHNNTVIVSKPRAFLLTREQQNTQRKVKEFLDKTSGAASDVASEASFDLQSVSDSSEYTTNPNAWMETAAERKRRVNRVYAAETTYYVPVDAEDVFLGHDKRRQNPPVRKPIRLPPLLLPPIHRGIQPLPLRRRSWTPCRRNEDEEEECGDEEQSSVITDEEWEDLKHCRYLRISNPIRGHSLKQDWHTNLTSQ